jgi:hypothetical protein
MALHLFSFALQQRSRSLARGRGCSFTNALSRKNHYGWSDDEEGGGARMMMNEEAIIIRYKYIAI